MKAWTPLEPLHLWPSLKSQQDEAFVSDSVRQQDIISYFSEPRWHKFQLPTSYFLKPAASREVSQGGKSHWQSAPRCPHSSFAFKSNILQIVFLTEDEDVSTVGALFDWENSPPPPKKLLNNADETRLCVRAIVSVSLNLAPTCHRAPIAAPTGASAITAEQTTGRPVPLGGETDPF